MEQIPAPEEEKELSPSPKESQLEPAEKESESPSKASSIPDSNSEVLGDRMLKIGDLAKKSGETVVTIRFWTKEGLLAVKQHTEAGYSLYGAEMVEKARQIRRLQREKRLRIKEIRGFFTQNTAPNED